MLEIRNGQLYDQGQLIGESESDPGFKQYIFEESIGVGASGEVFVVRHKILNIKMAVKIVIQSEKDPDYKKFFNEAIKNSNPQLDGIIATVFDAGIYQFPKPTAYSVMRLVEGRGICTFKKWRETRKNYFPSNLEKFDIKKDECRYSIRVSMNLAAGFLITVLKLYSRNVIHGDLNPGNIIWLLNEETLDEQLKKNPFYYGNLGDLEPYVVRLIDLGSSYYDDTKTIGMIRDSYKIYDHMKSFLFPLFSQTKSRFSDWLNITLDDSSAECDAYKIDHILRDQVNNSYIRPYELAGDFYRLLYVISVLFGFLYNDTQPEYQDNSELFRIMVGDPSDVSVTKDRSENLSVLTKLKYFDSTGRLINWDSILNSPLFHSLNTVKPSTVSDVNKY